MQLSSRVTETADSSSEQDGAPSAATTGSAEEDEDHLSQDSRAGSTQGRDGDGFRCAPCGFTSVDKEEFLQHIQTHRGEGGRALQCQLCGACFASGSSLSRHRFISHRVRGKETENKPSSCRGGPHDNVTPEAPDHSQGSPPQAEDGEGKLTCKVCGRHFSKAADLSTHFRTHGMAFITTYKTDKPA